MARISTKNKEEWKVEKNVFSASSERNLFKLSSQGFFQELESPLSIGKEANIFTARKEDGELIIVKIYRLENCNFNKMHEYIRPDPRYQKLKRQKRQVVFSWVQREYRNLLLAREVIKVPTPIAYKDNILLMEFIGESNPSSKVKYDLPKEKKAIAQFFKRTIGNMKKLHEHGLVHGDLSEYNILNCNNEPVFIDFSQSTVVENPHARALLERDVKNVCVFFGKRIPVDAEKVLKSILKK
ncbi:MAG: RIO1 family regulatory kinase/ATPase [Nanoarchaeota archaeon]